jgi:TPR repeat protein
MSALARISKVLLIPILSLTAIHAEEPKSPVEMTELARRYANGIGCPRDAGQAMLWYRRAAQLGEPGAMVAIADMLEEGRCVDQDLVGAVLWYRRAANLEFAPGMVRLAGMLERGRGAHLDAQEAHEWYRKAAKLGYGPAMTRLGDIEANPEWYTKAVAKLDPPAFGKLGLVTGDLGLFRRGAELGDGLSMTELGRNAADEKQAASWYRKAAEAGDPGGMERYAYFVEHGRGGLDTSFGEAFVWYKKAAEAGQPAAMTRIGVLLGDKKMLKRAVDLGYAPAMIALAKAQPADAEQLYAAAAQAGEPEALFRVGRIEESAARGYPEA